MRNWSCIFSLIPGDKGDPDAAMEFIQEMFLSVNPDPDTILVFPHFVQATDTESVKRLFQDVRKYVSDKNPKDFKLT